jgi:hypothetical protein
VNSEWESRLKEIQAGKIEKDDEEADIPLEQQVAVAELTDKHRRIIEMMTADGWSRDEAKAFLLGNTKKAGEAT